MTQYNVHPHSYLTNLLFALPFTDTQKLPAAETVPPQVGQAKAKEKEPVRKVRKVRTPAN